MPFRGRPELSNTGPIRGPPGVNQKGSLYRESEKAEPKPALARHSGRVRLADFTSGESAIPPHIGHSRLLGLVGR